MRENLLSVISLSITDIFDNEFGHGILAVKEVTLGNAIHIAAIR